MSNVFHETSKLDDGAPQDQNVRDVIKKIADRSAVGIEKYGTTTEHADLTDIDWLKHLQEELMDACVYLQVILGGRTSFIKGSMVKGLREYRNLMNEVRSEIVREGCSDILKVVGTARAKTVGEISRVVGVIGQEQGWDCACKMIEEGVRAYLETE